MLIVRAKLACFCKLQPIFAKCGRNWCEMQASFRKQRFPKMKSNVTGHIALSGGNGLTKPPCLIRWEWKWAGKATVMSVTALIVSATKKCSILPITGHKLVKAFPLLLSTQKWWKGSLSAGSVAFPFPSTPLCFPSLLHQRFSSDFLLPSLTFKKVLINFSCSSY